MARLSFRQGIVQHQTDTGGNPSFLQLAGSYVNLIVSPDYTIVSFVSGTTDYLFTETVTVNDAWGPFTPPQDYWLYWDLNLITGIVTRGSTTLEPIESPSAPGTPGIGQMWFNTVTNTWYEYNGSSFSEVARVFACKLMTGNTPTSMSINTPDFRGTQVGLTTGKRVGSLVFDVSGKPLRTGVGNKFFTTEDAFVTGVPTAASLRVETITTQGAANAPIAAFHVVEFYDFNKIQVGQPFNQGLRALGILEEDVVTNEVANFVTSGTIYNEAWDFSAVSVNDPVYFDSAGEIQLTETIPGQLPVGVIIGPQEILFVPSLFPQVVGQGGGVTDHSLLTGLLVDDHTQYHNDTRGDLRYLQLTGGSLSGNLLMPAATDVILTDLPVNPTDAANKQYVDQIAQGLDYKDSAHQCTVSDLPSTYDNGVAGLGATLTATTPGVLPPSITDNHADFSGAGGSRNRILVKNQTDPIENGIYVITDLGSGENVTNVLTTSDIANSLDGKYFTFEDATTSYYVWFNTPGAGVDPVPGGTGIEVAISTGAIVTDVTAAAILAINASPATVTAFYDEVNEFYIVDDAIGVRVAAADVDTGFTITTTIPGTASPTVWILTRADDADNSPSSEVSGGMFVFVEDGITCAGTGWVMTLPIGEAVLGTDELIFTQFSSAQQGPQSRIQDADNNTYVDVELTADGNNVVVQGGPRDGANAGGDINLTTGSGTNASGNDAGSLNIVTGDADVALDGGAGGDFSVTTGIAGQGGFNGSGGSISFQTQDGAQDSGSITLFTGDATGVGATPGAIDLRPGVGPTGTPSANVNIIGSATGAATVESGLKFIPKANIVSRFGVGFSSPVAVAADVIWKLPAADGSNGQVLTTDGSGILAWANPGGAGVNLWETILSDAGSTIASSPTDSLSILGGSGIDTSIAGDVLTITAVTVPSGFVLAFGSFDPGDEGDAFGTVYTSDNDITTWTGSNPSHGENFVSPKGAAYAPAIDTWVYTESVPPAYYSTDDGVTWTAATRVDTFTGASNSNTGTNLAWSEPLGLFIMTGNTGQIQKSSDGITWSNCTDAPKTTGTFGTSQVLTVTWSDDLALFFAGGDANQVAYSADGDTWTLTTAEPGGAGSADITGIYVVGSRIFVGRDTGTIHYSDNNGVTWNLSAQDVATGGFQPDLGFAANNDGSVIIMGGIGLNNGEYVWRSVDNGLNFTRIDVAASVGLVNMYTFCIIWDTDYGFIMGGRDAVADNHIIVTSPDGLTWTLQLSEKFGGWTNDFRAIASKNQDGQTAAAAGPQNLWETIVSDSGSTIADSAIDSLSIVGGTGISTAIVGDVLTVTATSGIPASTTECDVLIADNAGGFVQGAVPELPHPYDVAMQVFGEAPAGGIVLKFVAPNAFKLFDYGHQADADSAPTTGDRIFDVTLNGTSIGTASFNNAGANNGVNFDFGNSGVGINTSGGPVVSIGVGDIIRMISPSDGDSQGSTGTGNTGLEDISFVLRGHIEPATPCGAPTLSVPALDDTGTIAITASGSYTHFEVAVIAHADSSGGNPATATFYPLSDTSGSGFGGTLDLNLDDGTTLVNVDSESAYASFPGSITSFDIIPTSGSALYYLYRVTAFGPGGVTTAVGVFENVGA